MIARWDARRVPGAHALVLALACALVYANALDVPFVLDEDAIIVHNPIVHDLSYFTSPGKAAGQPELFGFCTRYVGYLTLALNYAVHGVAVRGYHVVNILLHLVNALLVHGLVVQTLRAPVFAGRPIARAARPLALFVGLVFAVHPLQTEAVNYVPGRFVLLVTTFYLAALLLYGRARLSIESAGGSMSRSALCTLAGAVAMACLAAATKQSAASLPLAIAAFELCFFSGPLARRAAFVLPTFLCLAVFPATQSATGVSVTGALLGSADAAQGGPRSAFLEDYLQPGEKRWEYLAVQPAVVASYAGLVLLPVSQNLNHDVAPATSLVSWRVILPTLLHLLVLGACCAALRRASRPSDPRLRLAAFGGLLWYVALSVESSFLPLPLSMVEYRAYLPMVGLVIAIAALPERLWTAPRARGVSRQAVAAGVALVVIVSLGVAAHLRNRVWQSRVRLWSDVVAKSPNLARGHANLGLAEQHAGNLDAAITHAQRAIELAPTSPVAYVNVGNAYLALGRTDEAIAALQGAVAVDPDSGEAHVNLGIAFKARGDLQSAVKHLERALELRPNIADVHYNAGNAYMRLRRPETALPHYLSAVRMRPDDPDIHNNLSVAYRALGRTVEAERHKRRAQQLRQARGP